MSSLTRITPERVGSLSQSYERTPARTTPAVGTCASFQTQGTTP
jgi:hypothetical protein